MGFADTPPLLDDLIHLDFTGFEQQHEQAGGGPRVSDSGTKAVHRFGSSGISIGILPVGCGTASAAAGISGRRSGTFSGRRPKVNSHTYVSSPRCAAQSHDLVGLIGSKLVVRNWTTFSTGSSSNCSSRSPTSMPAASAGPEGYTKRIATPDCVSPRSGKIPRKACSYGGIVSVSVASSSSRSPPRSDG